MAYSSVLLAIMCALVARSALAQVPGAALTISPVAAPVPPISTPPSSAPSSAPTVSTPTASPPAPPTSPASSPSAGGLPPSSIGSTPTGAPSSTPDNAAGLNRVTVVGSSAVVLFAVAALLL